MNNTAFQVTMDDLEIVLKKHPCCLYKAESLFDTFIAPEADIIEQAALAGNTMDEQTEYAHQEIELILRENAIIQ